jgi:2-oxoglutarate dehydrogenase E1 component
MGKISKPKPMTNKPRSNIKVYPL